VTDPPPETLLLGAMSLDRYVPDGPVLPGGGALNMAWHWRSLGLPFRLITRIGDREAPLFLDILARHAIDYGSRHAIVRDGPSASIDIEILPDREIWMDHYVPGVCADLRFTPDEELALQGAKRLHAILVDGVIAELQRLGEAGRLDDFEVVADLLGFRHYTPARFADTMRWVDLAIVGWPGEPDDGGVAELRRIVEDLGKRLVVTFGSRGVLIVDARAGWDRFVAVESVPVTGTTVGCGDAFIAYLLAEWWASGDLARAVERGKVGGALPTAWVRPLPDDAYGPLLTASGTGTPARTARRRRSR
jgi:sugar/nucleoside kinase (ribokinase family)